MTITAKVIAHSAHKGCPDLITLQLRYPRFIHSEVMTHRVFSRNASSSRAVPIKRMIDEVEADLAMPVEWGANEPGMQATSVLGNISEGKAKSAWEFAARDMIWKAKALDELKVHKQIVNRLLEPFSHISVVVTATDWQNFFDLRCHEKADPTMRALAFAMRNAIAGSTARLLNKNEWHAPYGDKNIVVSNGGDVEHKRKTSLSMTDVNISVARCARVSYLGHDSKIVTPAADLDLARKLRLSRHMSPFEHQAKPTPGERHANFNGWQSYRSMMEAKQ